MPEFKNALVTGGAGFIGSHLSKALLKEDINITVIDNLSCGKKENIPAGVDFVFGDILDEKLLKYILLSKDIDIIFHQAAKVSVRASIENFYEDSMTNIMGTSNILRALKNSKVKKFVYASSMAVYSDSTSPNPISENYITEPISPYGASKLISEKYCMMICEQLNIDCAVLRYFNTFGEGQAYTPYVGVITIFVNRLKRKEPIYIFGDGNQCRDFVHVNDIVQGNIRAMTASGVRGIFNIGTGLSTSVVELAKMIRDRINPEIEIKHLEPHPGELRNSIADISHANKILGYTPTKFLKDSIDEIINY